MKGKVKLKRRIFSVLFIILLVSLAVAPVFAAEMRASGQIHDCITDVTAKIGGDIKIAFDVMGKTAMKELGAEEIIIYRCSGSKWIEVDSYDRNDDGMTETNSRRYKNTIIFDGTSGAEYKVVITVFAEDSSGYDSRTKTHYVTAK